MAQLKETYKTNHMTIHGEIRKVEEVVTSFTKDGKDIESKAISLKIDDDDEERIELIDKTSDNLTKYKKGMTGTFTLTVMLSPEFGYGNYSAKILVKDFKEDDK